MNKLTRFGLSFTLAVVLAGAAFAGETQSPPCPPGETQSPPCTAPVNDDSTTAAETLIVSGQTPPASDSVDLIDIGQAVLWALSLF